MRQVPHYLLIGNGRVSRHFQHYFSLLKLSFTTWHTQKTVAELHESSQQATHILLLINDGEIDNFITQYLSDCNAIKIHCSGSLVSTLAIGAHPLMTFNENIYDLNQYQSIPFIIDHDAPDFENLLPGLSNRHVRLQKKLKAKYHALCVMSGNFSCLLWQKLLNSLEQEFEIPADIAHPYLQQQTKNLIHHFPTALTGPLVRNDTQTMERNLVALNSDPFQEIYQSFITCYQKLQNNI